MNKSIFIGSLKAAFAIIGAVIGAGFITGREIMKFFFGNNQPVLFCILLVAFTVFVYVTLANKNPVIESVMQKSNFIINILCVLTVASMLGATDSLARDLKMSGELPVFSVLMLIFSVFICIGGIEKLTKFNLILVPVMLIVLFAIIGCGLIFSDNKDIGFSRSFDFLSPLLYSCMNVMLTQPLLISIKKEEKTFSPLLTSLITAFALALSAALYLTVLPKECLMSDIPILYLVSNTKWAYYLVASMIAAGIVTTLVGSLYPLLHIIEGKLHVLWVIMVCLLSFLVSRLGFYVIVDKIYPLLSLIAVIYYIVIFCVLPLVFRIKARQRTLKPQVRTKEGYSSLQGQVSAPVRHIL